MGFTLSDLLLCAYFNVDVLAVASGRFIYSSTYSLLTWFYTLIHSFFHYHLDTHCIITFATYQSQELILRNQFFNTYTSPVLLDLCKNCLCYPEIPVIQSHIYHLY